MTNFVIGLPQPSCTSWYLCAQGMHLQGTCYTCTTYMSCTFLSQGTNHGIVVRKGMSCFLAMSSLVTIVTLLRLREGDGTWQAREKNVGCLQKC